MSKSHFNAPHFQTVEAAREYLEALRWGTERVCPHCGTVNESFATKKPGVYRCRVKECRKDFSVTTKSVMESSHIKLNVWLQAFFLMASSKKGVSSHQLHRALGITYKSAWFLYPSHSRSHARGRLDASDGRQWWRRRSRRNLYRAP